MQFYKLKTNFQLRFFKGNKIYQLFDKSNLTYKEIEESHYNALQLCNGKIDVDLFFISEGVRKLLRIACENGIIESCELDKNFNLDLVEIDSFFIKSIQWSITGNCNSNCRHCFQNAPSKKDAFLPTEKILDIIREIKELGVQKVSITGGEPLTRPDLPIIIDALCKNNIKIDGISTNGFLVNDKLINLLNSYNIKPQFQISFDGLSHHDFLRNVNGAEEMTLSAINRCLKNGNRVGINMCIHKDNIDSIDSTLCLMDKLGVESINICKVSDWGYSTKNSSINYLTLEETAQICLDYLPVFFSKKRNIKLIFQGFVVAKNSKKKQLGIVSLMHNCNNLKNSKTCQAVVDSCCISPLGRVLPCINYMGSPIEDRFPNLNEKTFKECLNDSYYQNIINVSVDSLLAYNKECKNCEFLKQCTCGCRAAAVIENNIYGIDSSKCKLFKDGWIQKFIDFKKEHNIE